MKISYCDIPKCKETSYKEDIDRCHGWDESHYDSLTDRKVVYRPFQKPNTTKSDLCEAHYKAWCRATYEVFFGKVK